jgi:hypothetical protein
MQNKISNTAMFIMLANIVQAPVDNICHHEHNIEEMQYNIEVKTRQNRGLKPYYKTERMFEIWDSSWPFS